jgi:lysophospholipase L1-like esterase
VLTGLAPDRFQAQPLARARPSRRRPARPLASLWAVGIALSLYGASEVQTWLRTSTVASRYPAVTTPIAESMSRAGRWTGLSRLHEALEGRPFRALGGPAVPAAAEPAPGAPRVAPRVAGQPAPVGRVLIVGASTIQFHLGVELERALRARAPALVVQRLGKLSTGLTRPDVFDWPAKLRALTAEVRPDLVIANFGGNDAQAMVLAGGEVAHYGSPRWEAAYRTRVREIVTIAGQGGARVLMLGMSTTRDPVLSRRMEHINALTEEASRAAGADFLSIWDLGADAGGHFQDVAVIDGVPTRTRLADGKHFSRAGALHVVGPICDRLAARYRFVSAAPPSPAQSGGVSRR